MKAACDLYDADWSGILIADLHSQMWRPEIWYEVATDPMQDTLFHEFEMTEEYITWMKHLKDQEPLVIPDVEAIKESSPGVCRISETGYKSSHWRPFWTASFGLYGGKKSEKEYKTV